MQVHAACAARDGWAVLLLGPSGSGKSDLLFRLLYRGWALVADDRVDLEPRGQRLVARAPVALSGMIELRGLGLVAFPAMPEAALALAVELRPAARIARLPEAQRWHAPNLGLDLPLVALDPFHASAEAKLDVALDLALGRRRTFGGPLADEAGARGP